MSNSITWFEIPVKDYGRATKFYSEVLNGPITEMEMPNDSPIKHMGQLPGTNPHEVGGAIVEGKGYEPTDKGATVFLNAGKDLNPCLDRVKSAGGQVVMDKTHIGKNGYMAQFIDCEGNKIALHSPK